jgi:hypothetical protein
MTATARRFGSSLLVIAMIGLVASSSASAGSFDIEVNPAVLIAHSDEKAGGGFQQHILTVPDPDGAFNVICDTAIAEGTTVGASLEEATLTPTLTGCRLSGTNAVAQMNGCKYTLTGADQPEDTFLLDITGCTAGKQIQIKSALCTIDIPEQNGLSHVVAANVGGEGSEVTLSSTLSGITATQTGAACPGGNLAHTAGATSTANTVAEAFQDAGVKQATKHGHQYQEPIPAGSVQVEASPAVLIAHSEMSQQHIVSIPNPPGSPFNAICDTAASEGTSTGTDLQEITLTPTLSSCKLAGTAATVQMNGCKYTLTGANEPENTFTLDIVGCTAGKQIQIKTALCTVDIPEQAGLSHVVASNAGSQETEVTLSTTVSEMTAVQTGAVCPGGNLAHTASATISASTVVEAVEDGGTQQVTKHGHQYEEAILQAGTLEVGASPAVITAHSESQFGMFQQHVLSLGNFNSVCDTATFEGTVLGTGLKELTLTPTFQGCQLPAPTARLNGCKYTLTGAGQLEGTFIVDIAGCTAGKQIRFESGACTIDIPEQNGLAHIVASNVGGKGTEVTLSTTLAGVTAVQTGAACPGGQNGHTSAASLSGNTLAKAFTDQGNVSVTKHGHQYTETLLGAPVAFSAATYLANQLDFGVESIDPVGFVST